MRCSNGLSRDKLIHELKQAAQSMALGTLSEPPRQCGDPPARTIRASRHGRHLYFRYNAEGKVHSVYVPPDQGEHRHVLWWRLPH